jgi:hypothetical protein
MTVRDVLQLFGDHWAGFQRLGPIFTERVDYWAGVVSRREIKRPGSFPLVGRAEKVQSFVRSSSCRPREKFRAGRSLAQELTDARRGRVSDFATAEVSLTTVASKTYPELPHEEFVESCCKGLNARASSIVRRLAQGEKIADIADALGIPSRAIIKTVSHIKGRK